MRPRIKVIVPILIALVIATIIAYVFIFRAVRTDTNDTGTNDVVNYYRITDSIDVSKPSLPLNQAMTDAFKIYGGGKVFEAPSFDTATFLLFETLNHVDTNLMRIKYPGSIRHIYGVLGTDIMASKSSLAHVLRVCYGPRIADTLIPKTYILSLKEDRERLKHEFDHTKVYIMKKNIQRQEGNHITKSIVEMSEPSAMDYVIVQEMLQDPFLVNQRKINLRVYLLVVAEQGHAIRWYIYRNGFIYYTPLPFKANSVDKREIITTGYIDRKVYAENPLTHEDLVTFMGKEKYDIMFANIMRLMAQVKKAFIAPLRNEQARAPISGIPGIPGIPGAQFLIYGCDIAPDEHLGVKLMEINKGPDVSYKDERDREVKLGMMSNAMMLAGVLPPRSVKNKFLEVA